MVEQPDIRPSGGPMELGRFPIAVDAAPSYAVLTDQGHGRPYCLGLFATESQAVASWRELRHLYGTNGTACWIEPLPKP